MTPTPLRAPRVVRAELAARGLGLLICLLTLAGAFALVAGPRAQAAAADADIRQLLHDANPAERALTVELRLGRGYAPTAGPPPGVAPFDRVDVAARRIIGAPATALLEPVDASAATQPFALTRPSRPFTTFRQAVVRVDPGLGARVRWDAGAAPGRSTDTRVISGRGLRVRAPVLPVAVATATAERWGVGVGDLLRTDPGADDRDATMPLTLRVVGTFTALDPANRHWEGEPLALRTQPYPSGSGANAGTVERAALLADPAAYGDLGVALFPEEPSRDGFALGLAHTWRYAVRADAVADPDLPELRAALTRLEGAGDAWGPQRPQVRSGLAAVADRHAAAVETTRVVLGVVTLGVAALVGLLTLLTVVVVAAGRRPALALLAARGASAGRVGAFLAAGLAGWVVAGAVLGGGIGWAVTRGGRGGWLLAVVALAAVPLALAALLAARRVGLGPVRRLVIEIGVVAAALLVVTALVAPGTGSTAAYAAAAPVLVALAAAVVTARVSAWPLGALALVAERGRGAWWFLAFARAARDGGLGMVPMVAVVLAATLSTVLAGVSTSVDEQRGLAAYRMVGADLRLDLDRVDPADAALLAERPGVEAVAAASVRAATATGAEGVAVTVIAADPSVYAEVVSGTPLSYSPKAIGDHHSSGALPVIASADLAGVRQVTVDDHVVPVRVVAVEPHLARDMTVSGSVTTARPVLLVPLAALQQQVPGLQPDTLYARADAAAADAVAAAAPLTPLVRRAETTQGRVDRAAASPFSRLVRTAVLGGSVASMALTVLSVLLLLSLTAPARRDLVVRLRTMGLGPTGGWRLGVGEVLPQVVSAAVVGTLVGVLLPGLLVRAVDLGAYTGGPPRPPLRADGEWAIMVVVLALVAAVVALVADQARARRADLAGSLRSEARP